jgi:hypothetical protein
MTIDKNLEGNQPKNDQAEKDLDAELQKVLDDEGAAIEPSEGDSKPEPVKPVDPVKPEEEPDKIEPKVDPVKPEPVKQEPEPKKDPVERPQRFIPIPKYKEEKKTWEDRALKAEQERDEALKKKAELEAIAATTQSKDEEEEAITKFCEENDMEVGAVKGLMKLLNKGESIDKKDIDNAAVVPVKPDEIKAPSQEDIVASFNKEFESFTPDIKKIYPDANEEQIKEAQKVMDEFAHSPSFNRYPLSHILAIKKGDFDLIFGKSQERDGIEGGRGTGKQSVGLSANDFSPDASGAYDFSVLHSMQDGETKQAFIDGLSTDRPKVGVLSPFEAYIKDLEEKKEYGVNSNGQVQVKAAR